MATSVDEVRSDVEVESEFDPKGYRPSVVLAPHQELRLLDEALDEARVRPRPPPVTCPAPPAPVRSPVLQLQGASAHGHANNGRADPVALTSDPAAEIEAVNADDVSDEPVAEGRKQVLQRWRIDSAEMLALLGADGVKAGGSKGDNPNAPVDRKRLLAAIICILQEELVRNK